MAVLRTVAEQLGRFAGALAGRFASPPRIRVCTFRKIEMDWMQEHPEELRRHRGEWIVVEGAGILASDKEYKVAREAAIRAGVNRPLIFFVSEDDHPFIGV